jgi:hypothetical protein
MRKRLRELPELEKEEPIVTYGRPSVSSWVAAAAVAFAFFVLGGFIKTYGQLENLREESRREIGDLRDSVRQLHAQLALGGGREMRPVAQGYRIQPLPPARRDRLPRQDGWEAPSVLQRMPDSGLTSGFDSYDEQNESKPRVQFGRSSNEESRQIIGVSGTPCQVVSVSGVNKRVMIEGGRDVSLIEGMRLELCRDGRWIGDLRVLDVFDNQSSCEVLHTTLAPEPGDTIRRTQR